MATTRAGLAELLLSQGQVDEALVLAEQAWEEQGDVADAYRFRMAFVLARALWASEDSRQVRERARKLAERALEICRELIAVGAAQESDLQEIQAWLDAHHVD